jgi:hypothetical protein
MNEMYCVVCGLVINSELDHKSLCSGCVAFSTLPFSLATVWVPAVCGDDVCYNNNGDINLDGDCSHYEDFYAVLEF